jgi:mannose-6-phosphate isomerase-like protein (cupin superfamily)
MFLVLRGRMRIDFRDGTVELGEGDAVVVPRGVEHRPAADEEWPVLLFEPASTVNTGGVRDARTRDVLERI